MEEALFIALVGVRDEVENVQVTFCVLVEI